MNITYKHLGIARSAMAVAAAILVAAFFATGEQPSPSTTDLESD